MYCLKRGFIAGAALLLAVACEKGDLVSPGFAGKPPVVSVDTIAITDIVPISMPMYTGTLNLDGVIVGPRNGAVGSYNDPAFGQTSATHMMRPRLITTTALDTIDENTRVYVQLPMSGISGDTLFPITIQILDLVKEWRGSAWTKDSVPDPKFGEVLATFNWTNEDSMLVELPSSWKLQYRDAVYYDPSSDTTAQPKLYGFALRAQSTGKLVMLRSESARLMLEHRTKVNNTTRDTVLYRYAGMSQWATSYSTALPAPPADRYFLDNTFQNMLSFDIRATRDALGLTGATATVLSAELVFYEDTTALKAGIPVTAARYQSTLADVYYLSEREARYDLTGTVPTFRFARKTSDASYRLSITSVIATQLRRNQEDALRFYMSYKSNGFTGTGSKGNDGTLARTILYSKTAAERKPVLIITKAVPDV